MYAAHFGLTEPPFSITPDPRYLYMSEAHREALAHLLYGLGAGGGFVQLTGEVGTGKTTLCRCLLEQLPPGVDVAFVLNPKLTDVELLASICDELRIPYPSGSSSRKVLVDALHHHLLDAHARGRRTVLIIDEAQDLPPEVLEQIRLLTNLETTTEKLLQIILIGQPELVRLLERDDLRQLAQRVTARYHLVPFGQDDTRAYIAHRLAVGGRKERLFTESAMRQVHHAARGVPRLINAICDRALLGAYTEDQTEITASVVRRAAHEVLGRGAAAVPGRSRRWMIAASVGAVLVSLVPFVISRVGPSTVARVRTWIDRPAAPPSPSTARTEPATAAEHSKRPRTGAVAMAGANEGAPSDQGGLAQLLADPTVAASRADALASLFSRWGIAGGNQRTASCERARGDGLQCVARTGNWARVRRYDLPAILELASPAGDRRYAALVGLTDDAATLDIGGQRHAFRLSDFDRFWDGGFVMLWRPPESGATAIAPGARGSGVTWVRQRLDELDGTPVRPRNRDVFDEELRARVIAFQRGASLVADGIVGEETLIRLSAARRDPNTPRLTQSGS